MGSPVMGSSVMGSPVMGSPVMGSSVMGSSVMGSPVMGCSVMAFLVVSLLVVVAQARADVRDFAAQLRVTDSSGETSVGTVTFVELADGPWLLTAYHTLDGLGCADASCVRLVLKSVDILSWSELTDGKLHILPELGIAGAKLSISGAAQLRALGAVFARPGLAKVGVQVRAVGNPRLLILGRATEALNYVASGTVGERARAIQHLPSDILREPTRDAQLLYVNGIAITYGYSGGPLAFEDKVVGIVQGGDPKSKTLSWSVPIESIVERLVRQESKRILDFPARELPTWPFDGFKAFLYSRPAEESVIAVVSKTEGALVKGEPQKIAFHIRVPSEESTGKLLLRLRKNRALRQLEAHGEHLRDKINKVSWEFVLEEVDSPQLTLDFQVLDATGQDTLHEFSVTYPVRAQSESGWAMRLGTQWPGSSDESSRFLGEVVVGVDLTPGIPLAGSPRFELAPRLGASAVFLEIEERELDPLGSILDSRRATVQGVGVEAALAARYFLQQSLNLSVGAHGAVVWFPGQGKGGLSDNERGLGPEVGLRWRLDDGVALALRYAPSYWWSLSHDRKYETIVTLVDVDEAPGWKHRLHVSYAF